MARKNSIFAELLKALILENMFAGYLRAHDVADTQQERREMVRRLYVHTGAAR